MTIINTSPDRIIQLGYEGEDRVTVLRFRYGDDWLENGEGIFRIRVRRHGENHAYNAQLVTVDLTYMELLMTVTDVELSVKGSGEMQVVYSGENFVKKSPIYSYNVSRAVDEVADPPAQDVYTQIIESLSDLQTDVQGKADIQTVSALADAVNGLDSDVQGLQTTVQAKADTSTVTALSGTVSGLQTAVQSKADAQTVTALSGTVTDLQTSKADKTYVDVQLDGKASTQAVSDLADDVSDLQTGLASKVGDVQLNGTSVVSGGVANITASNGLAFSGGALKLNIAAEITIKAGVSTVSALYPAKQHTSTFYGLAKAAGYDEKNSTLPVGTYSEEAKTAIRTMLGLQDVYEDYSSALTALGGGS